jgi:molybdate transport system substrate-binding protein
MRGWGRIVAALAALAVALTGCSSDAGDGRPGSAASDGHASSGAAASSSAGSGSVGDELSGTLTVFAAASLTVAFDRLRTQFLAAHPDVDFPEITYDGSSTLATQIQNGAPADVFASADETTMETVAGLITDRVDFATNSLQIAVAPGNPKGITSLADLAKPGVVTVICQAQVPCGTASHRALDAAGVDLKPASEEQNVTAVLTKVETGDADAGLVYATDVNSSGGKVEGVGFPEAAKAVNTYPIAVLKDSANAAVAKAFVDMVTGPAGRTVLAGVGFGPP